MNESSVESVTLLDLLGTTDMAQGIVIPMIQRDYAQGRSIYYENGELVDVVSKRNDFLEYLYFNIMQHKRVLLDFVYGETGASNEFEPLDGQQRLTTLFLLHWYAQNKERIELERNPLKNFKYEIRQSSTDFCEKLSDYPNEEDGLDCSACSDGDALISLIKNKPWFRLHWNEDPTVASMLTMIGCIHDKFKAVDDLWFKLSSERLISFHYVPLEEFGLSDDLYIKMNSRGKPLTEFEHFKNEFIRRVRRVYGEDQVKVLSSKIDVDWTNIFWEYRSPDSDIDSRFLGYFSYLFDVLANLLDLSCIDKRPYYAIRTFLDEESPDTARKNLEFLTEAMDCWLDGGKPVDIPQFFEDTFYLADDEYLSCKCRLFERESDGVDLFRLCTDIKSSERQSHRLLLFACIIYRININCITSEEFAERIRIVRNLIMNSTSEIRADNMPKLYAQTKDIVLSGDIDDKRRGFNTNQVNEEKQKLKSARVVQLRDEVSRLEDTDLLRGSIAILMKDDDFETENIRKMTELLSCDLVKLSCLLSTYSLAYGNANGKERFRLLNANRDVGESIFHRTKSNKDTFDTLKGVLRDIISRSDCFSDAVLEDLIELYHAECEKQSLFPLSYYFSKYPSSLKEDGYNWFELSENSSYMVFRLNSGPGSWIKDNNFLCILSAEAGITTPWPHSRRLSSGLYELDYSEDELIVFLNGEKVEELSQPIRQENGIDTENRILLGLNVIKNTASGG